MIDWQLIVVLVLVAIAGAYTVRVFILQFRRPDDEEAGCAGCPVAEQSLDREKPPELSPRQQGREAP